MPSLTGMRHPLGMEPSVEAPQSVGSSGWWILSEPCCYIHCSRLPTKWSCCCVPYTNIGVNHVLDRQPVQEVVEIHVRVLHVVASCYMY